MKMLFFTGHYDIFFFRKIRFKMMKNGKIPVFRKKSILFMDHSTLFIPYSERDLLLEAKIAPIPGGKWTL